MIDVVRLWNTVNQLAKTETSGYQDEQEFNNDMNAVQQELLSLFSPLYSANQTLKDILSPFIKPAPITTSSSGIADEPLDYYRRLNVTINGYPCYPIAVNEKDIWNTSPIRKPSVAKNIYVYWDEDGKMNFLPKQVLNGSHVYIRVPLEAEIELTPVSTADADYVTPTSVTDLEWDDNVFNIFVYKMLDRLGMEMKDSLAREYALLGIQSQLSNI